MFFFDNLTQGLVIVGLIIALGLLVDNAIVETESIHRENTLNKEIKHATASDTSKVAWLLPVTVVLVLFFSLLVALTLTPLLASKLLVVIEKNAKPKKVKINTLQYYANKFSEKSYTKTLTFLMRYKAAVIVVSFLMLVAMFSLFEQVGVSLFPKAEKPMLLVNVTTPANSSLAYTDKVLQQVRLHVKQYELVDKVALNIGNANPRIYYNEVPKRGIIRFGQALLVLKAYQADEVTALVKSLRDDFNHWQQAEITVKEFSQGPVTDQVITIRLLSESLDDLEQVANDLAAKMRQLSGVVNIDNPIGMVNTELALTINYQ